MTERIWKRPRYQECSWPVRLWRRQWKVWYTFIFLWWLVKWLCRGAQTDEHISSRWSMVRIMWYVSRGSADAKMLHVFSMDEVREELRKRDDDEEHVPNPS